MLYYNHTWTLHGTFHAIFDVHILKLNLSFCMENFANWLETKPKSACRKNMQSKFGILSQVNHLCGLMVTKLFYYQVLHPNLGYYIRIVASHASLLISPFSNVNFLKEIHICPLHVFDYITIFEKFLLYVSGPYFLAIFR